MSAGMTFYWKAVKKGDPLTNPDGALRSLIGSLDWVSNSELSLTAFNLNIKYPLSPNYTLSAGYLTDLGSFSRIGFSFKRYLQQGL